MSGSARHTNGRRRCGLLASIRSWRFPSMDSTGGSFSSIGLPVRRFTPARHGTFTRLPRTCLTKPSVRCGRSPILASPGWSNRRSLLQVHSHMNAAARVSSALAGVKVSSLALNRSRPKSWPVRWAGNLSPIPRHLARFGFGQTVGLPGYGRHPAPRNPRSAVALCQFPAAADRRPYIVVVDTGSRPGVLASVEAMQASDLEVHRVAPHGTEHPTEAVGYAIDLGQSLCRTEWMLSSTPIASFIVRPRLKMLLVGNGAVAARRVRVGSAGRVRIGGVAWSRIRSRLHVPTADSLGAGWSLRRLRSLAASLWPKESILDRQDPEVLLNELFRRAGVSPVIPRPRDGRRHRTGCSAGSPPGRDRPSSFASHPQAPAGRRRIGIGRVVRAGRAGRVPALDCGVRDRLVAAAGFGVAKRGGVAPWSSALGPHSPPIWSPHRRPLPSLAPGRSR